MYNKKNKHLFDLQGGLLVDKNYAENNDIEISIIELIKNINDKSCLYKILTFIKFLTESNN